MQADGREWGCKQETHESTDDVIDKPPKTSTGHSILFKNDAGETGRS